MPTAHINNIATATPPHDFHAQYLEYAANHLGDSGRERIFRRMAGRANIAHRWTVMPDLLAFFGGDFESMAIGGRMRSFTEHAASLAVEAVTNLELGDQAAAVTHLITVTTTGFCAPGFDLAIVDRCGIAPSVERTHIGFMGCFAGVTALRLAHHIVRSEPTAKILLVAVEICSIHMRLGQDVDTALSHLLFGDGCAAALVSAEPIGIAMESFTTLIAPNTSHLMKLSITNTSVDMLLSGQVPLALGKAFHDEATVRHVLAGAERNAIKQWAIHPGGRSVLDAVANALKLTDDEVDASNRVLTNYGNLASVTILYVLADVLSRSRRTPGSASAGCALAFGPGVTIESMLFRTGAN